MPAFTIWTTSFHVRSHDVTRPTEGHSCVGRGLPHTAGRPLDTIRHSTLEPYMAPEPAWMRKDMHASMPLSGPQTSHLSPSLRRGTCFFSWRGHAFAKPGSPPETGRCAVGTAISAECEAVVHCGIGCGDGYGPRHSETRGFHRPECRNTTWFACSAHNHQGREGRLQSVGCKRNARN